MGLFKKLKDILYDEEEYTEQIKITPEMRNEETPAKVMPKSEKPVPKEVKEPVKPVEKEEVSEREIFSSKSPSFPFFDFDEDEFEEQKVASKPVEKPIEKRNTNIYEIERKRKIEKRVDYGRYERTETVETVERKKFKPSPIISPVYGILNQDYNKDEIVKREPDKVDIQSVRNKAFGEHKENIEPKKSFYEETETVTVSKPAEKEKKVKTIDELLEDTSDIVVDIDQDMEVKPERVNTEPIEIVNNQQKTSPEVVEDTLENDLFDLIDSMYDNKEEGE